MAHTSLTQFCFETLAKEIKLERITGLEDIEQVNLLSGEEGGGIRLYKADKIDDAFKERQKQRIKCQYDGMRQTDRMGKILLGVYGKETFAKFFKAMA